MHNEAEWLKLVFLLADTQAWLDDMAKEVLQQLPLPGKKKFLSKTYYLRISALAHILERHYHKINRYPHAGKFTIAATELLHYIREAHAVPATPAPGGHNWQRVLQAPAPVGFDRYGHTTHTLTVITDAGGNIITAYPGNAAPPAAEARTVSTAGAIVR